MSPILRSIKFETKWFRIRTPIYLDISHFDHMDTWFRLTNEKRFILTSIRRKRIEIGTVVTMIYLLWSLIMWSHATRQSRNSLSSPPQELPPKNLIKWLLVVTKSHQISLLILFSCGQVRSHVKCYIFSSFETYEHQKFQGTRFRARGSLLPSHITTWSQDHVSNEKFRHIFIFYSTRL